MGVQPVPAGAQVISDFAWEIIMFATNVPGTLMLMRRALTVIALVCPVPVTVCSLMKTVPTPPGRLIVAVAFEVISVPLMRRLVNVVVPVQFATPFVHVHTEFALTSSAVMVLPTNNAFKPKTWACDWLEFGVPAGFPPKSLC